MPGGGRFHAGGGRFHTVGGRFHTVGGRFHAVGGRFIPSAILPRGSKRKWPHSCLRSCEA
jgi:hypothetical protein